MKQKIAFSIVILISVVLGWLMARLCMDAPKESAIGFWYEMMSFILPCGGVPLAMWFADM